VVVSIDVSITNTSGFVIGDLRTTTPRRPFGGDCFESGAVEGDYIADFCGLTQDDRVTAADKQQA
jgi:hypothetical protein